MFSLEALEARHGDCLLLHYGTEDSPRLAVIDGGPSGVFVRSLRPRLEAIRHARAPEDPLPIDLLMVSHLDDDHIHGILDLASDLADLMESQQPLPYTVGRLWHNSFDDVVGNEGVAFFERLGELTPAETPSAGVRSSTLAVAASVGQGRELRDRATRLGLPVNAPFETLVAAPSEGLATVSMDGGLDLVVVAPRSDRVEVLQQEWDREIREKGWDQQEAQAKAAEYLDRSVFNLSSIVVLARVATSSMLLTGDARGDDILEALAAAGLMDEDRLHVDLLKLPHHGSQRNVEPDFFERVTADHYVISANGDHGNPEVATLQMIADARGAEEALVHLTNEEDRLVEFFDRIREAGKGLRPSFRDPEELSLRVDLAPPGQSA